MPLRRKAKRPVRPAPRTSRPRRSTRSALKSNDPGGLPGTFFFHAIESSPVAVIVVDLLGSIQYINPHFSQLTGFASLELVGHPLTVLSSLGSASAGHQRLWNAMQAGEPRRGEFQICKRNGELSWELATIIPLPDPKGNIRHVIAFLEDVTSRKQSEQLIEHMAFYDALTNLPNRTLFNGRLRLALEQARQQNTKLAVLLLDLDRFKIINDTLGHTVGDELIQQVGRRIAGALREGDTLARMGGDEFMLLLAGLRNFREAFNQVKSLMALFNEPFECGGQELHVNASMGISLYPEDGEDPQVLVKNADTALFEAKDAGRNHYMFFTARSNSGVIDALSMETAFRHALEHEEFRVFYQPQIDLASGRVISLEALVRWQHPELGLVMPDQFIPLAEETGLIVPLGKWVLRTACQDTVALQRDGYPLMTVAVNLSARQFQESELVETVLNICKETGLNPEALELELTESILLKNLNLTGMILRWLHKKGVRLAIDDFGTGYSSLLYLKRLPIDQLKIDRSFIRDCLTDTNDMAIVKTITSIAHNLNLELVAEGVETSAQLQFLQDLGCRKVQGFLFAPGLSKEELIDFLKENQKQAQAR